MKGPVDQPDPVMAAFWALSRDRRILRRARKLFRLGKTLYRPLFAPPFDVEVEDNDSLTQAQPDECAAFGPPPDRHAGEAASSSRMRDADVR